MQKRLLFFLLLFPWLLSAQQTALPFGAGPGGVVHCATVENMQHLRSQYPDLQNDAAFESWLDQKMREEERSGRAHSRMVLTIPVVFHIIHYGEAKGTGQNLSAAQIQSQLDILNEDFRRMSGTPGFNNDPAGADTEIEFCMAFWDPNDMAMAEPGINRIEKSSRNWPLKEFTRTTMEDTVKPQSIWDPNKYYNVWVTDIGFNEPGYTLLGYAQFPSGNAVTGIPFSGPAHTDGVVILHTNCGRLGRAQGNSNQGRTLTHETGHWLGLRHVWGDGPCGADDYCNDTPESDSANYSCKLNHISCGSLDMVRNYMDYSLGTCKNIFTNCQKTRMRTVLLNAPRRASLMQSTVCQQPTTTPVSAFSLRNQNNCDGVVSFTDSSQNLPTAWFWIFGDGGTSTLRNPTHTYAASGIYTVRLVTNNSFGTHVLDRQISVNVSSSANIHAGPDLLACRGDSISLGVQLRDSTASVVWQPIQALSNPNVANPRYYAQLTRTFWITATDTVGCVAKDTLVITVVPKPILDAGADVSIAYGDSVRLNPTFSKTAAHWRWTPFLGFLNAGDDSLSNPLILPDTSTTYHLLATDTDGCQANDSLSVTVEGGPPNTIHSFEREVGHIHLPYPHPGESEVLFSAEFHLSGSLQLRLYDLNGKEVANIYEGKVGKGPFSYLWQRDPAISTGMYFLLWQKGGRRFVQKMQLR